MAEKYEPCVDMIFSLNLNKSAAETQGYGDKVLWILAADLAL